MASPLRLSLIRHQSLLGGDRIIVGLAIILGVLFGWVVTNGYGLLYGLPLGAVIWTAGVWIGQQMYKGDPYARQIWWVSRRYQKYYPPRAHHAAPVPAVKDFI